jgi:hypothetical protein
MLGGQSILKKYVCIKWRLTMFIFGLLTGILGLLLIQSIFPTQTVTVLTWIALRNRQLMAEIKKLLHREKVIPSEDSLKDASKTS